MGGCGTPRCGHVIALAAHLVAALAGGSSSTRPAAEGVGVAGAAAATTQQSYSSFRPGKLWLDTDGNVIRAHSGGLLVDPQSNRTLWYGSE